MPRTATTKKTGRKDKLTRVVPPQALHRDGKPLHANRLDTDSTPTRTMFHDGTAEFVDFPRVDDTKRYAKFNLENDGNGSMFGAVYVPLDDCAHDVVAVRVTFVRGRRK